jgi:hypothetical protein
LIFLQLLPSLPTFLQLLPSLLTSAPPGSTAYLASVGIASLAFTRTHRGNKQCTNFARAENSRTIGTNLHAKAVIQTKTPRTRTYKEFVIAPMPSSCRAGSYRGVVSCRDCPRGYYSKEQGAYECAGCETGKFSDVSANNHGCEYCAAGKFSFGEKNTYCSGCSVGQSSNSVVGQSVCTPCQVGYFAPRQAMPNCLHPKDNSVVNETGSSISVACPANSLADESFTSCKCERDFFKAGHRCIPCTEGMNCSAAFGPPSFLDVHTLGGWWTDKSAFAAAPADLKMEKCYRGSGGQPMCLPSRDGNRCQKGMTGPLCASLL